MKLKINMEHEFNVNCRKYNSVEEVPEDLREIVRKAVGPQPSDGAPVVTQTKVIFNGAEYDSVEAMPQNVRTLYEEILKAAKTGAIGHEITVEGGGKSLPAGYKSITGLETAAFSPEPVLSLRKFITGLALAALLGAATYYFLK